MFNINFSETFARFTVGALGTSLCAGLCLLAAAAPAVTTANVPAKAAITIAATTGDTATRAA